MLRHAAPVLLLLPLLCQTPLAAQSGLKVQPDPENVVASRILGKWRLDADLSTRTGARTNAGPELEFRRDDTIVDGIPEPIATKLKGFRIYLAGVMVLLGKDQPFLVTELKGNPHVVWFRERNGDPMGDAESFHVMLARGAEEARDLLFTGGDRNNQPFTAYARATGAATPPVPPPPVATTIKGAVTDMVRLLQAGKHLEFVKTYADPDDLKKAIEQATSIEKLAEEFGKGNAGNLLKILESLGGLTPKLSDDGNEASYALPEGQGKAGTIRFRRVEQRWYLRN